MSFEDVQFEMTEEEYRWMEEQQERSCLDYYDGLVEAATRINELYHEHRKEVDCLKHEVMIFREAAAAGCISPEEIYAGCHDYMNKLCDILGITDVDLDAYASFVECQM